MTPPTEGAFEQSVQRDDDFLPALEREVRHIEKLARADRAEKKEQYFRTGYIRDL
jgi:hypothetical protein